MDSTINYAVISIIAVVGVVAFLFIAKRVLRVALRLMFVGVLILALLAGGAWAWWNGWFDSAKATPRSARPVATPRRTPR